jgi:hypothetical protein
LRGAVNLNPSVTRVVSAISHGLVCDARATLVAFAHQSIYKNAASKHDR